MPTNIHEYMTSQIYVNKNEIFVLTVKYFVLIE